MALRCQVQLQKQMVSFKPRAASESSKDTVWNTNFQNPPLATAVHVDI